MFFIFNIAAFGGCSPSENISSSEVQIETLIDRPFSAALND